MKLLKTMLFVLPCAFSLTLLASVAQGAFQAEDCLMVKDVEHQVGMVEIAHADDNSLYGAVKNGRMKPD